MKYHVEINHVREVSLVGHSDLAFWKRQLRDEALFPASIDGKATVLISSVAARFNGIRFRELSFSVAICRRENGPDVDGVYLVHAFNSNRFFALVERIFFHTPYYKGDIRVDAQMPASFHLTRDRTAALTAEMSETDHEPSLPSSLVVVREAMS